LSERASHQGSSTSSFLRAGVKFEVTAMGGAMILDAPSRRQMSHILFKMWRVILQDALLLSSALQTLSCAQKRCWACAVISGASIYQWLYWCCMIVQCPTHTRLQYVTDDDVADTV